MDKLDEILKKFKNTEGGLIPALQEAQEVFSYLPKDVLVRIARGLKVPLSQVYGVVTFYSQFFLTPHGKYTVRACRGTACHVQGAKKIISTIENIIVKENTPQTDRDESHADQSFGTGKTLKESGSVLRSGGIVWINRWLSRRSPEGSFPRKATGRELLMR